MSAPEMEMVRGKTGLFRITVTKVDGTAQSLVGLGLVFSVRYRGTHLGVTYDVSIQKTSASGIDLVGDGSGGLANLTIADADTASLPADVPSGSFADIFELVLVNGDQHIPIDRGTMLIHSNVGTP